MLKGVKEWCDMPVIIKPFLSYDGMGDKTYDVDIPALCYMNAAVTKKVTVDAVEIISTTCLYVNTVQVIKKTDVIVLDNIEYIIHSVDAFYRDGTIDLQVVYI